MRVNIYAEEMTDRVEVVSKTIDGHTYTGLRFYLELPVTLPAIDTEGKPLQARGPFIHRDGDDDSSAVTFWGKRSLRAALQQAITMLDRHYAEIDGKPYVENSALCPHCSLSTVRTEGTGDAD